MDWSRDAYIARQLLHGLVLHGVEWGICEVCNTTRALIPCLPALMRALAHNIVTHTAIMSADELDFLKRWMGWSDKEARDTLHLRPGETLDDQRSSTQMLLRLLVAQALGPKVVAELSDDVTLAHWGTCPVSSVWIRAQYQSKGQTWALWNVPDVGAACFGRFEHVDDLPPDVSRQTP